MGVIPSELGRLSRLRYLHLQDNRLTGWIPPELGQLAGLYSLNLSRNQLTGWIPVEFGNLTELISLHLQHNQLTGRFPPRLRRLTQLWEFSFRGNRLTGPVPKVLSHLPDVYVLNLDARWEGSDLVRVTWDDPGDLNATHEYRLRVLSSSGWNWTPWTEIEEPATSLEAGEGLTLEWLLTDLPKDFPTDYRWIQLTDLPKDFATDYQRIQMKVSNSNGSSPVVEARVQRMEGATLYFPHYADGGGWSVQLAFSNLATTTEDAALLVTAYDRAGEPISGFFDSEETLEIPPLDTQVLRSAGAGGLRSGWIEARTDSDWLSGLLTFRYAPLGIEAGVEPVALGRRFYLQVEESSTIGTGLAIFKQELSSAVEFRIRDEEGRDPLQGQVVRWKNFQQEALTLAEWFDVEGVDREFLQDFRGVLYLQTADRSAFAPIGLRFGKGGDSLSAIPVFRGTEALE